jgi:hypothetical protein
MENIAEIVENVCTNVNERAQQSDTGVAIDQLANSRFAQHLLGSEGRSKSMVAIKKERAERARRLKYARHEKNMLISFLRLVDYLEIEKLVNISVSAANDFLRTLQSLRNPPTFQTTVEFTPDIVEFKPSKDDFEKAFHNIVECMRAYFSAYLFVLPALLLFFFFINSFRFILACLIFFHFFSHNSFFFFFIIWFSLSYLYILLLLYFLFRSAPLPFSHLPLLSSIFSLL